MSELPAPAPPVDADNEAFWEATSEHRLLLPRCPDCGLVFWYPRSSCPGCGTAPVEWIDAIGRGTIYSFTIQRRPTGAYRDVGSCILAYVELAEGPRVMTNIVESDDQELTVGQDVEVVFHDTGAGPALYRFRPVTASASG